MLIGSFDTRSPINKPQLSNEEVFAELVSQRLAQGFQLILVGNRDEPKKGRQMSERQLSGCEMAPPSPAKSYTSSRTFAGGGSMTPAQRGSLLNAPESSRLNAKLKACIWLSLGDHYHKITLSDGENLIEVKKYRPKKELERAQNLSFHYR